MAEPISISWATSILSASIPNLSQYSHHRLFGHETQPCNTSRKPFSSLTCEASRTTTPTSSTKPLKKKNRYEIENLTTWLLKQEQAGHIDADIDMSLPLV
ncbi:fructose-1,6-bisphosphatase, chloroplastic-like protein [Tanacetum coccineum]|uniref:Fructose-1,6-bisphosphatase, chloroplastic-like protein n=1 Tax=Tanacetum coccineum TaxID=301880 RepID=A0ABQ4YH63_9ASTR